MIQSNLRFVLIFILVIVSTHKLYGQKNRKVEKLTRDEIVMLDSALQGEYRMELFYDKVIGKFGKVVPFSNVIFMERIHTMKLKKVYRDYGLVVPVSKWLNSDIPDFKFLEDACLYAKELEAGNINMYARFIQPEIKSDIRKVFMKLKQHSETHLQEFHQCN